MKYIKDRYLDTDIHIALQENEKIGLAQSDKLYKLSLFSYNHIKPRAIVNCSYFYTEGTTPYAVGREQGDSLNQRTDNDGITFVYYNGKWDVGEFKSWDYTDNVDAGFTVATLLIKNGKDVEESSSIITDAKSKFTTKAPQTCIGITNDDKLLLFVSEGRNTNDKGLTGREVRDYLKAHYSLKYLAQADGGGSSEMIVDGQIMNYLSDGSERPLKNGLCLYSTETTRDIMYPCSEGWDSQGYSQKHKALDFGWLSTESKDGKTPILACDDGIVEFEGFYKQNFGKVVYPIGVILKHNWSNEYDYYTIYWHLSSSIVNKGDIVKKGQQIGTKGNTGLSNGVHLHFQTLKLPKGMPLPQQYNVDNWDKYSIDVTKWIEVYPNQKFKSVGNFVLRTHQEEDTEISRLRNENELLKQELGETQKSLETLKNKVENIRGILND